MQFSNLDFEFDRDIMVMGDLHGVWNRPNSLIAHRKPKIVLQVGDFGWWPKFDNTRKISTGVWRKQLLNPMAPRMETKWRQNGLKLAETKLYFCPGNHEDWVDLESKATSVNPHSVEVMPNVFYMPKTSVLPLLQEFTTV